jgi:hypothetical protein
MPELELDEYARPETAIAVAATALLLSPRVRRAVRRGLVYAVAGGLTAIAGGQAILRGARDGFAAARQRLRPQGSIVQPN